MVENEDTGGLNEVPDSDEEEDTKTVQDDVDGQKSVKDDDEYMSLQMMYNVSNICLCKRRSIEYSNACYVIPDTCVSCQFDCFELQVSVREQLCIEYAECTPVPHADQNAKENLAIGLGVGVSATVFFFVTIGICMFLYQRRTNYSYVDTCRVFFRRTSPGNIFSYIMRERPCNVSPSLFISPVTTVTFTETIKSKVWYF